MLLSVVEVVSLLLVLQLLVVLSSLSLPQPPSLE
jgi:hypothetical protein